MINKIGGSAMQINSNNNNPNFGMAVIVNDFTKSCLKNHMSKRAYRKLEDLIEKEKGNTADIFIKTKKYAPHEKPEWATVYHDWDFVIKAYDKDFVDNNVFISTLRRIKQALKYAKKYEIKKAKD